MSTTFTVKKLAPGSYRVLDAKGGHVGHVYKGSVGKHPTWRARVEGDLREAMTKDYLKKPTMAMEVPGAIVGRRTKRDAIRHLEKMYAEYIGKQRG